jgi:hypothetical protein
MTYAIPDNLPDLTRDLVQLRKKPTTQERFKAYPSMLQRFKELVTQCDDVALLREVIRLDEGYYLLAGYRQEVLERWMSIERTSENVRLYAMQLMLFGDTDEWGEADLDVQERVDALHAEADALETEGK